MQHQQSTRETPVVFDCQGNQLVGIIHQTDTEGTVGVLIVVGGPQYRAGSHRQFVLLARHLAQQGVSVMRFDARGMGDGEGEQRSFKALDDDIRSAIDHFVALCTGLKHVIIWGLCDAASAALFYAYQDHRVTGLVLLNPWVFTEQGAARTYLKHYYLQRLMSPDFWRKIFSLNFDVSTSVASFAGMLMKAVNSKVAASELKSSLVSKDLALPVRMRECFKKFGKPVLLVLSGRDLTADEFKMVVAEDSDWQLLLNSSQVKMHHFPEADHTFSSAKWRDQVAECTLKWIRSF